jgi:hypothetical protein
MARWVRIAALGPAPAAAPATVPAQPAFPPKPHTLTLPASSQAIDPAKLYGFPN